MSAASITRKGMSIMELIVAMALLSLAVAIATPLLARKTAPPLSMAEEFIRLRKEAIEGRAAISRRLAWADQIVFATAFPDGLIIADSTVPIDSYTGAMHAGTQ